MEETKREGEVWNVHDPRRGTFTVKLLHDVQPDTDWVQCEIVAGRVNSIMSSTPKATAGETYTMRQCFIEWVGHVQPETSEPTKKVVDLMDALRLAVEEAKKRRSGG